MARYREGMSPETPVATDDGMIAATALLGLFIGLVLAYLGFKSGIWWLRIWGSGLVLSSIAYLVYQLFFA